MRRKGKVIRDQFEMACREPAAAEGFVCIESNSVLRLHPGMFIFDADEVDADVNIMASILSYKIDR